MGAAQLGVLESLARLHDAVLTIADTKGLTPQIVAINNLAMEQDNSLPNTATLAGKWTNPDLPEQFRVTFKILKKEPGKVVYICTPVPSTPYLEDVDLRLEYDVTSHQITGYCICPFDLDHYIVKVGG